jgi:hypothetical protein
MPVLDHLWIIPLLPLLGAAANGLLGRGWSKKRVSMVALSSTALAFAAVLELAREFFHLTADQLPLVHSYFTWIAAGGFRADFALQVDQLTLVMLLVVTGVGWLIHIYSTAYMSDDPGYTRFFAYLNLFMFFMLILVLAANYALMFVGWEGVGLSSYLLIGFWFLKPSATNAGNKAFWVNRVGDFGFLLGIVFDVPHVLVARFRFGFSASRHDGRGNVGARRAHGDGAAAVRGRDRKIGATSAVRVAAGRDGRPHAGERADSRRDDGYRRRLHGRAIEHDFHARAARRWPSSPWLARSRRYSPRRSRWCRPTSRKCWPTRRFRNWATCSWAWVRRFRRGHFSFDDARIFQGSAVSGRGQRDSRHGRRAGSAQNGRAAQENSMDVLDDADGHAGDRWRAGIFRLFQQGRYSGIDRHWDWRANSVGCRRADGWPDGVLHVSYVVPGLPWRAAL